MRQKIAEEIFFRPPTPKYLTRFPRKSGHFWNFRARKFLVRGMTLILNAAAEQASRIPTQNDAKGGQVSKNIT